MVALAAFAAALLPLLAAGCVESPFSPPPRVERCGSAATPCAFDCEVPCVQRAVDLAESCVVTLEGRLDATRRRCAFDDGTRARFGEPLASAQAAADHQTVALALLRPDGTACLELRAEPGEPGGAAALTGQIGGLRIAQEVWRGSAPGAEGGDDGGPLRGGLLDARAVDGTASDATSAPPTRVRMTCEGKVHEREGSDLCGRCGDVGCPALLELRAFVGAFVELRLTAGSRTTPLFTCRAAEGGA